MNKLRDVLNGDFVRGSSELNLLDIGAVSETGQQTDAAGWQRTQCEGHVKVAIIPNCKATA
jgi:hypothetical protein